MNPSDGREQRGDDLTRRQFFTRPFAWIARRPTAQGELEALPDLIPLSVLKHFPEAALLRRAPVLRQRWTARVRETGIAYRNDSGQGGIISLGPEGSAATRFLGGVRTSEQVAAVLGAELGMAQGLSAAIVREAFLTLAEHEVYHPNGPLAPLDRALPEEDHYA